LSWNNSGGSATAGIRAVSLFLQPQQLLKCFQDKNYLTNKFATYVGFVKDGS
jgi:hypothetical protein